MGARFGILGRLAVGHGPRNAEVPRGHASAILAALLAEPNRTVPSDDLLEALWGEHAPRTATNALQVHVAAVRKALRAAADELAERLETDDGGYRLRVEPGELDAEVFAAGLAEARRTERTDPDDAATRLRAALGLWRGPVLDGIDIRTAGAEATSARLEEQRLETVELLAELDLRLGRPAAVAGELEAAVRDHPYRERLASLLMLALYRAGRQADALAAYQHARTALADDLGIEPGPELRALELAILRHDPALLGASGPGVRSGGAGAFPSAAAGDVVLPAPATRFVGRAAELAALVDRLPGERLVTVVGVGGAGKTRFAIQAAGLAAAAFPDGVRFLDLGATPDAERLALGLAEVHDVAEQPGRPLLDVVGAALGSGRRLLLLDTCEHLIEPVAAAATALLDAAPGLTILATSREPLRLGLELVWQLGPLGSPDVDEDRTAPAADEAVDLFVERAARVQPGRHWSAAELRTIRRICRRLDGLPLAIEMAAARSAVLSPGDIEDRLAGRFRLLDDGARGGAARHRTLRAAFDWSHDLLERPDQITLRRLAVFAAPVSPAAVDAVCGDADVSDPTTSTIRLAERSLVVATIDADGRSRFGLLDTVREYGLLRLRAAGEEEAIGRRHVGHWLAVADEAYSRRLFEPDARATALEAESAELRAAVDRAHDLDPALELQLCGLLGWFWVHHTHIAEGRQLLDRALAAAVDDDLSRARALTARGGIAAAQGDAELAEADLEAALAIWRRRRDRVEETVALDVLGWARFWAGRDDPAMAAFEAAVAIADEVGQAGLIRRTRAGLCQVLVATADVARARPLAEELVRLAADDLWVAHLAPHYLADCALTEGDPATALEHYRHAMVLAEKMANATETALEVEGYAMALAGTGDAHRAVYLFSAAEGVLERLGVEIAVPFWLGFIARYLEPARAVLGPDSASVRAAGRALGLDEAVAFSQASADLQPVS